MSILESKNGDRLNLRDLGAEPGSFFITQHPDGTVFEMAGASIGGYDLADQALRLMMGHGFSAGDEVEWKNDQESGGSVTVTILRWEYHPSLVTTTFGDSGRDRVERTPHRWKLWLRQNPASTVDDNPPHQQLGFLRPGR